MSEIYSIEISITERRLSLRKPLSIDHRFFLQIVKRFKLATSFFNIFYEKTIKRIISLDEIVFTFVKRYKLKYERFEDIAPAFIKRYKLVYKRFEDVVSFITPIFRKILLERLVETKILLKLPFKRIETTVIHVVTIPRKIVYTLIDIVASIRLERYLLYQDVFLYDILKIHKHRKFIHVFDILLYDILKIYKHRKFVYVFDVLLYSKLIPLKRITLKSIIAILEFVKRTLTDKLMSKEVVTVLSLTYRKETCFVFDILKTKHSILFDKSLTFEKSYLAIPISKIVEDYISLSDFANIVLKTIIEFKKAFDEIFAVDGLYYQYVNGSLIVKGVAFEDLIIQLVSDFVYDKTILDTLSINKIQHIVTDEIGKIENAFHDTALTSIINPFDLRKISIEKNGYVTKKDIEIGKYIVQSVQAKRRDKIYVVFDPLKIGNFVIDKVFYRIQRERSINRRYDIDTLTCYEKSRIRIIYKHKPWFIEF